MWQFLVGFTSGLYVGTYYDCKPILIKVQNFIKENSPEKKNYVSIYSVWKKLNEKSSSIFLCLPNIKYHYNCRVIY